MSETSEHKNLVEMMARRLSAIDTALRVAVDLPDLVDFDRPPKISGFIPDVYAFNEVTQACYICEAKILKKQKGGWEIDKRSLSQIAAFIDHIDQSPQGLFILGAYGNSSIRAKSILRCFLKERKIAGERIQVFDGLDYWRPTESKDGTVLWDSY